MGETRQCQRCGGKRVAPCVHGRHSRHKHTWQCRGAGVPQGRDGTVLPCVHKRYGAHTVEETCPGGGKCGSCNGAGSVSKDAGRRLRRLDRDTARRNRRTGVEDHGAWHLGNSPGGGWT